MARPVLVEVRGGSEGAKGCEGATEGVGPMGGEGARVDRDWGSAVE